MKTKLLAFLVIFLILFESCSRNFTPYQAANNPRGKKCGVIR